MTTDKPSNTAPRQAKGPPAYGVIAVFLVTGSLLWGLVFYAGFAEIELEDGAWGAGFMALLFTLIGLGALYLELKPEKRRSRRRRRSRRSTQEKSGKMS